jgi:hypothetical protein
LQPSSEVPAQIVSFGQIVTVAWRVDVKLACHYVGKPMPSTDWIVENERAKQNRMEIGEDNTLTLRNVQRIHESNYTCNVRNALGVARITYQLLVQVPPGAPRLQGTANSHTSASLHWHLSDNGGAPIKNYLLTYRRHFGEWHEIIVDRRSNSFTLENLQCGTEYEFTIAAFNKIGSGSASDAASVKTAGEKPIAPHIENFLRVNTTSVLLELIEWQNGGCPILYFTVEYKRRYSSDWIIVSSNVASQARFPIGDLEPSTVYNLRVQAHNNAGSTIAEYTFETFSIAGGKILRKLYGREGKFVGCVTRKFFEQIFKLKLISLKVLHKTIIHNILLKKTFRFLRDRISEISSRRKHERKLVRLSKLFISIIKFSFFFSPTSYLESSSHEFQQNRTRYRL